VVTGVQMKFKTIEELDLWILEHPESPDPKDTE